MSHGIDVCMCGAVVMQCRCLGPHTKRVVCETCGSCRSRPVPKPTTPVPTTASLHREMVEALRAAQAALDEIAAQDVDWRLGTADNVNLLQAMAEEALYGVVPALEGWEKRPRLRGQQELRVAVASWLCVDEQCDDMVSDLLDALEPLLYGERG